jgi:hypothetical protein
VQWQMVIAVGSTSASKVIRPQWQCPSIFMGLSLQIAGSGRARSGVNIAADSFDLDTMMSRAGRKCAGKGLYVACVDSRYRCLLLSAG